MSTTRKVLTIIFSILIIAAFAFVLTWGIINFNKVKDGMSGNGLYTQGDVQNAYEDGYNKALADKDEYDKLINSYRDTITTQNDLISQYTSEATTLNNSIKDYQGQIATFNEQKAELQSQIDTLNTIKASNETTIDELNGQIAALSEQVLILTANKDENAKQIESLNLQIANLQSLNTQLQETNELNVKTINGLNAQIVSLNNQINELSLQMQNNQATANALNVRIAELQKSVSYYEQYLGTLESGEQVVATFEFAGSVYNIQVVNKNSILSVTTPTSTAYIIFNGWTVDGEMIDLSTFYITVNTRIVADVTYKYEVNFMADGENHHSQIVVKDETVSLPSEPIKSGYVFEGWTLDGNTVLDLTEYEVNQHTTFIAKFTKLYSVVFKFEDITLASQMIKSGQYAIAPEVNSTAYKVFNGWTVNGISVDVGEYRITADTVFVSDITYKYDVKFMADGTVYNTQIVEKNNKPTVPANPIKSGYMFEGWSVDGTNIVDISKYVVTENVTFTAIFQVDKLTVTFKKGNITIYKKQVQNGSYSALPDFDEETFLGWTIDGNTVVDVATYKITADTTFIAKFGQWTAIGNGMYYGYGNSSSNKMEVEVSGLKAGDKFKITANFSQANIDDTGNNSYWYNSAVNNVCYGWQYNGNGGWSAMDEYGNVQGDFGDMELSSLNPLVTTLGIVDYATTNTFTITVSCKKDGYLTVEWSDSAGFYIDTLTLWQLYVMR
jgi:uncharacterized repeat protein (TIGR02543 family)